jgi:hypothetical protein
VLAGAPYSVRAPVSVEDFRQFVLALEGQDVEVTQANFDGLSLLCKKFRFEILSERLSAFRQFGSFREVTLMEDSEARLRLSALEERLLQRDRDFALLRDDLARQSQTQESTAAVLTAALVRLSRTEADVVRIDSGTKATLALETELGCLAKAQVGLELAIQTVSAGIERLGGDEFVALRQAQESTAAALAAALVRLSRIEAQFGQVPPPPPPPPPKPAGGGGEFVMPSLKNVAPLPEQPLPTALAEAGGGMAAKRAALAAMMSGQVQAATPSPSPSSAPAPASGHCAAAAAAAAARGRWWRKRIRDAHSEEDRIPT